MRRKTDRTIPADRPVCPQIWNGLAAAPFRDLSQRILQLQKEEESRSREEKKQSAAQNRTSVSQSEGYPRIPDDERPATDGRNLPE